MADRAGGGAPLGGPQFGWALPNWVTALTYQPWTLLPSSPLSPNTTNRCTFDAQFARILMWPPSVFRGGRPKLAWGHQPPRDLTGVWFPGGRARERLASRDHGGNGLRLGVGARFWLEPRGPMIELTCSPTLTQDPNRASASRRAIHERRSRPFRSLNAVAAPYAASGRPTRSTRPSNFAKSCKFGAAPSPMTAPCSPPDTPT